MLARPLVLPLVSPITRSVFGMARGGWSPLKLFAAGEQGAWYDPSDISSLYQDSAGTLPVTAFGQPVGLMLDKSGRGNHASQPTAPARPTLQARTNLFLSSDNFGAPWIAGETAVGSGKTITFSTSYTSRLFQTLNLPAGTYTVSANFNPADAGKYVRFGFYEGGVWNYGPELLIPADGSRVVRTYTSTGVLQHICITSALLNPPSTSLTLLDGIQLELGSTPTAYQRVTSATNYADVGAKRKTDFDGVDDYLRTVFPNLGANVTIARSIPGVGAQILTGQTIAAGNRDDSTDHCGLLIINRGLTGDETTKLTAWLNARAGV